MARPLARRLGHGPGLILLHGGMQSSRNFVKLANALSDAFTLYIPDRRGCGLSGPHGQSYNLSRECEAMEALVAATGARDVFALSSGAIVALQSALILPAIRRLALYEPPQSVNHSSPNSWVSRFDDEIAEGKQAGGNGYGDERASGFLSVQRTAAICVGTIDEAGLEDSSERHSGWRCQCSGLIPTQHFDVQSVIETEGTLESYKEVLAEVLLLGGDKSPAYLRVSLDALSETLPHVWRIELEGLDHLGADNDGRPEQVASELRKFFTCA